MALDCLAAGVAAGDPERVIRESTRVEGDRLVVEGHETALTEWDRVLVVGAGKAAGRQARAVESLLGDRIADGIVVTTEDIGGDRIAVKRGDHPLPSNRNVDATRELCELIEGADESTLILVLISGGGSALLAAPSADVTLGDLQSVTRELLNAGADIDEINAVRKHLSAVKGGQLARLAGPARVVALVMSDVVGDDPAAIASGPTVPDSTTFADARAILDRYDIDVSERVSTRLDRGTAGEIPDTPGPDDPIFDAVETHVIATGATAVDAAAKEATARGYDPLVLSTRVRGDAREAGRFHVAIAEEILVSGNPTTPPAVILSGGEATVTVDGDGRGGPNQEFALAAALAIVGPITVASMDTDGIDGTGPAAGGIVDMDTVTDRDHAVQALADNDAFSYLSDRDDAIMTGATGTNLNDLRVLVVESRD